MEKARILGKAEELRCMMYHVKSLSDLLVVKVQSLVDGDQLKSNDLSDPIWSIAEMLKEKAEASLKTIEDLEEVVEGPYDRPQQTM